MSSYSWNQSLVTQNADSTALTASTAPTSIINAQARITISAGLLAIGQKLLLRASGRVTTVTTPGTLTFTALLGSSVIWNGGAITLNATAQTNATWYLEVDLIVRAVGTSSTILGIGNWTSRALVGSPVAASGSAGTIMLPDTAPVVGTAFDSTVSNTLDLFGTWGTSNANSILTHQYEVVLCN